MAPRTRKTKLDDFTRDRIKTTQLVKRLQEHALTDLGLEQSQIKAIEILLRKSLPDLSAVTIAGDPDQPVQMVIKWQSGK
jgi:hypothetical protein